MPETVMKYTFPVPGKWPIVITHEINPNGGQHRVGCKGFWCPWLIKNHLAMIEVHGRQFVAQLVIHELPICFEYIPAAEFKPKAEVEVGKPE